MISMMPMYAFLFIYYSNVLNHFNSRRHRYPKYVSMAVYSFPDTLGQVNLSLIAVATARLIASFLISAVAQWNPSIMTHEKKNYTGLSTTAIYAFKIPVN